MGFYSDRLLPPCLDWIMRRPRFEALRPSCAGPARGRVLELGFGSGLNLPHYGGEVDEVLALDPSETSLDLARGRMNESQIPVTRMPYSGERIPLDRASVDSAVSTWTLCSIRDVEAALAELRRVLKPGGRLHFMEHGLSPRPGVARWQRRLTPLQRRIAGGCHLDRPIDRLLQRAGFELEGLRQFSLGRPRFASWHYQGAARNP